jgi:hypothetical protein
MKKKTIASSSKIPSKITTKTVTSISKDEFVAKLFSKSEKSKISEIISKVEKKDLLICQELLNCLKDDRYKISSKVKLTTLSIQNIQAIVKNTNNHSLLSACLYLIFDQKTFLFIYEKMNKLGLLDNLYQFLNKQKRSPNINSYLISIFLSDIYNETIKESFKYDLFNLTLNLINNESLLLEQIKKDRTSKIVGNLKPAEMEKLIDVFIYGRASSISELILSQNLETVPIEFVRNLRAKLSPELIVEILKNENILRSTKHLSLFIEPRLKEIIGNAQNLEKILPLLLVRTQLQNFGLLDLIADKTKELLGKKEGLAIFLEDPFLRDIESKNDQLIQLVDKQKIELMNSEEELKSSKVQIDKLKKVISFSEERNMGDARNEIDTRAQRDRQVRIDIYKELIKVFEKDLNTSNTILENFGLEQIGLVSEKFAWDQEICESITSESLTEGLVVKSGYVWWDGNSKVVIRRILLKAL